MDEEEAYLKSLGLPFILIGNKVDKASSPIMDEAQKRGYVLISAAEKTNLAVLKNNIVNLFNSNLNHSGTVITNLRHYECLTETQLALGRVLNGLSTRISGDFIAMDIRQALFYLGSITGEISTDDLLDSIFSRFCIGK